MALKVERSRDRLFSEVQAGIQLYGSLSSILEKTEVDGYFSQMSGTFESIIRREMSFAVCGKITRDKAIEGQICVFRNRNASASKHNSVQGKLETDFRRFK